MSTSTFIYSKLNPIQDTYPAPAPAETAVPFIIYNIDGQETIPVTNGNAIIKNFVTISAYANDYDSAVALGDSIKATLSGAVDTLQGIMGVTYNSLSYGYDGEPLDRHYVTLEFSIYER